MKRCTRCGETKPFEQFSKDKSRKDGKQLRCKQCNAAYHADNRSEEVAQRAILRESLREGGLKECSGCKEIKPLDFFNKKRSNKKDGRRAQCKQCQSAYTTEWYAQNPGYNASWYVANRAYIITYRAEHREAKATAKANRRAKVKLPKEDRAESTAWRKKIKDDPCYYCEQFTEVMHDDHVIPLSRGGTDHYWNIVRACSTCNLRKNAKTDLEYLAVMPLRQTP